MLTDELKERAAANIKLGLDPIAAMQKAQADMLANNPWVPPTNGCPVNEIPPELLGLIFQLGCEMQEEEEDADDESDVDLAEEWETDDEEGSDADDPEVLELDADDDVHMRSPKKRTPALPVPDSDSEEEDDDFDGQEEDIEPESFVPFQVLVSHVCRHWRSIAINSHTLWTKLRFNGHLTIDEAQTWLTRSNGLPLEISIDCTHEHPHPHEHEEGEEQQEEEEEEGPPCISVDDLKAILDLLAPHFPVIRLFEVSVKNYSWMYAVLEKIAECPAAPLLEEFGLYNYEETEETEHFQPADLATAFLPFHGIAPKLQKIAMWGVHIDWDSSLSFLRNLTEIEFAYHVRDVRPKAQTFRAMLQESPRLEYLSLCFSGPSGDLDIVEMPALRHLVLSYIEQDLLKPLINSFVLPVLEELTVELMEEDYSEFVTQLVGRAQGLSRSLLAGLTLLKIACLSCNDNSTDLLMAQLENLKRFDLNCAGEEERFFDRLLKAQPSGKAPLFCPRLEGVRISGMEGSDLRKLVIARRNMGVALKQVFICRRDFVSPKDDKWLRENVETFEYYEPSESEDELVEIEGEEEMEED
ncbi:hypothetical protein C8F01DRAFT_1048776 [Mycena amicta]|nr:hypothetical protein C8F01DRAFT_1048776 [Mycena amicta]